MLIIIIHFSQYLLATLPQATPTPTPALHTHTRAHKTLFGVPLSHVENLSFQLLR